MGDKTKGASEIFGGHKRGSTQKRIKPVNVHMQAQVNAQIWTQEERAGLKLKNRSH